MLAQCDVKFRGREDNETIYTDFRRVLERTDIDVVAIATPPGWHAPISIAAMEAGKDVLCEKPMVGSSPKGGPWRTPKSGSGGSSRSARTDVSGPTSESARSSRAGC
jgi:hypothetical protein